jgi:murein DD-endopeptidase MepM/ murein hydrolase activator NlpD
MAEKKNSVIFISIIIILILAFISIGYLAYKNYKLNQKLDNFIEYTNNLLAADDDTQSKKQVETVQNIREKDTHSKNTFILSTPIKSEYHIGKTYGFYKNSSTNDLELHEGIDFVVVSSGIPVYSAYDGTVTEVGFDNDLGNYVTISHSKGFKTRYCNLSAFRVKRGQFVSKEKIIANVGNTGKSDETHLGFRLYDSKGNIINPTDYFRELPEPTIPPDKNMSTKL